MEKVQETIGLSREFIIHPGETLAEVLEDRDMSQKELAIRTGVTEKHVSTVLSGKKSISVAFAKKLEYALGIEAAFWINLQANYDRELLEFEEVNNISEEELSVLKHLQDVTREWCSRGWMEDSGNPAASVLDLRRIMGISNLCDIPDLTYTAAYRAQKNIKVDSYVLYAWQCMCELQTKHIEIAEEVDIDKLKERIPQIKKLMFLEGNTMRKELKKIFAECGIAFDIVRHFSGAPVQGFVKKTENDYLLLCVTLRQAYADVFWFSLFHEIGHIIHGNTKNKFIDFEKVESEAESRADRFAANMLIPPTEFRRFVQRRVFTYEAISDFADQCEVKPFIVLGRLMKEGIIGWDSYADKRMKYVWR